MGDAAQRLSFNGVNGSTGDYLFRQVSTDAVAQAVIGGKARGEQHPRPADLLRWRQQGRLQAPGEQGAGNAGAGQSGAMRGVAEHVDANLLEEAGWGIVTPFAIDPRILDALRPLLEHRRAEATAVDPNRYREFTGRLAYRPDERSDQWLARQGVGPGPVDPDRGVPYYLLIVGGPDQIPYRFQSQLDLQYAVGRVHFPTIDAYRRYAESVVQAETRGRRHPRRVALAGVANGDDLATQLSAQHLLAPLSQSLTADRRFAGWAIDYVPPSDATRKAGMAQLIGGPRTPPLLFTASHGMGFDAGDPRQLRHQGALLCQDWPGHSAWGRRPIPEDFYLSADDIDADAQVWGSIFFHFACYSAGTPQEGDFDVNTLVADRPAAAPHPFVAGLPQRLLSHESGGALAVIGHVDRAWTYSFRWQKVQSSVTVFADAVKRLMRGHRVGLALEKFNERYGEIAVHLNSLLDAARLGGAYDQSDLADLWTASNDARSYMIVGDPAVRLAFEPGAAR